MLDGIKSVLTNLLAPLVRDEVERRLAETSSKMTEFDRRLGRVEENARSSKGSQISAAIGIGVAILTVVISGAALWYQFIRQRHSLNGYVIKASATEKIVSAELVFSNEGNRTEVISGGNFIYGPTNDPNWKTPPRMTGTNSLPIVVLRPGEMQHVSIVEPFLP